MSYTEEEHKTHDPENPIIECSFCVAQSRTKVMPLRHGEGSSTRVVPLPVDTSDD